MHILQVISGSLPGQVQGSLEMARCGLEERGYRVTPVRLYLSPLYLPGHVLHLWRVLLQDTPGLVMSHGFQANRLMGMIGRFRHVPHMRLATRQGMQPLPVVGRLPKPDTPAHVVRQGYEIPAHVPLVVCSAPLQVSSGHGLLLTALSQVREDIHLVCTGDGDMAGELKAQADRLRLGGRVRFVPLPQGADAGQTTANLLAAADLFVHSALWEASGQDAIDAAHAGLPLLLSDIRPFRLLTQLDSNNMHAAEFVMPQNIPALAQRMEGLLSSPSTLTALRAASRRLAAQTTREKLVDAYESHIRQAFGGRTRT